MINSIDVVVYMRATQSIDSERESFERRCPGKLFERGDAQIVKYRDAESGTIDTIEIRKRRVRIKRSGAVCSMMEFAAGESHVFEMTTELAEFGFLLKTSRVAVGMYEDRITIELVYDLFAGGELVSQNRVEYRIEEAYA